jgi:hypothetical protein
MSEAGLWWPQGNIRVTTDTTKQPPQKRFVHLDLEYPNNTEGGLETFFHRNEWRYGNNVCAGIGELAKILQKQGHLQELALLKQWVVKNPHVRNTSKFPDLYKELNLQEIEQGSLKEEQM